MSEICEKCGEGMLWDSEKNVCESCQNKTNGTAGKVLVGIGGITLSVAFSY